MLNETIIRNLMK